jgi:thiosulfate reductase cytochrome b subunit
MPPVDAHLERAESHRAGHARWVRVCHWLLAASVLTLAFTGFVVLMSHPRLYWGEAGNDLTPALLELPISRNYKHGGWEQNVQFSESGSVVSATRTYDILNENGWGRSLHFLAAWFLVATGAAYVLAGALTRHLGRDLMPRASELAPRVLWHDLVARLRKGSAVVAPGPPYGALQKLAYFLVVFLALPLMVVTGLAMSPAITAAYPLVAGVWGGAQSARTIHFFVFGALVLFTAGHLAMAARSGFGRQIRALTWGG